MSWIAVTDFSRPAFDTGGLGAATRHRSRRPAVVDDRILPVGTLVFELVYHNPGNGPWRIVTYSRHHDWLRELHVEIAPDGHLILAFGQGAVQSRAEIDLALPPRDGRMRISFSWDAPRRVGRLTVEFPEEGRTFQVNTRNPAPLPVRDVEALICNDRGTTIDPAVCFIAVSDEIEPVGQSAGIAAETTVETPDGPRLVKDLRLGDYVVTAGSGSQPIRWIGQRTVPAMGGFRPIRIRAPFFGLARDVVSAPDHRVRLDLDEAEYILGDSDVLVPASILATGRQALRETRQLLATYYQILLDVHDCLLHDGLWAESLFVGTIGLNPQFARSTVLADMPASAIPVHRNIARKPLWEFEARGLAASLQHAS